jgi:iron complex transport system ATP-binding protein
MTLEVTDVAADYRGMKVLEHVDLSAAHGELLGIIGPNGSGKTTLLRTISRILKPKMGTIVLDERDVLGMKEKEFSQTFAAVPQDTGVQFSFSALDVVLMGRNPYLGRLELENERDMAIAKRCMELTNCWHLAERPINELSGGERQLVIIAQALTQEPTVLLLDEPTSHLDITYQLEIMELLKQLTVYAGLIIIAVIHDLNLAAQYCDRLVMLHNGKIVAAGLPQEVLTAEHIKDTFGAEVIVRRHALTNHFYVSPLPLKSQPEAVRSDTTQPIVHLICGGGKGAPLMYSLIEKGYTVTAGVLNMLDTDCDVAQHLDIPLVTEAPFSSITDEAFQAHLALIERADVVVLCSIPFGFGNMKNLEAAETVLKMGKRLVVFDDDTIEERDFTGGEATKRFHMVKQRSASIVKSTEEVLNILHFLKDAQKMKQLRDSFEML